MTNEHIIENKPDTTVKVDIAKVIEGQKIAFALFEGQTKGAGPFLQRQLIKAYARASDEMMKVFDAAVVRDLIK